jgi:uncharacterized membrane protein
MGIDGNLYRIVLIAHLVAATAAFGPLFLYPRLRRAGETSAIAQLHMRFVFPSLVALWVLGMGLAGLSDDVWKVSQTWLTLAIVDWVAALAVSWFLIRPAIEDRSEAATSKFAAGVGISHVLLVIGLYLMVFKPGL